MKNELEKLRDELAKECEARLSDSRLFAQSLQDKLSASESDNARLRAALEWIAGDDKTKPYCTYYERTLDDGTTVPTTKEIAQEALKCSNDETT